MISYKTLFVGDRAPGDGTQPEQELPASHTVGLELPDAPSCCVSWLQHQLLAGAAGTPPAPTGQHTLPGPRWRTLTLTSPTQPPAQGAYTLNRGVPPEGFHDHTQLVLAAYAEGVMTCTGIQQLQLCSMQTLSMSKGCTVGTHCLQGIEGCTAKLPLSVHHDCECKASWLPQMLHSSKRKRACSGRLVD